MQETSSRRRRPCRSMHIAVSHVWVQLPVCACLCPRIRARRSPHLMRGPGVAGTPPHAYQCITGRSHFRFFGGAGTTPVDHKPIAPSVLGGCPGAPPGPCPSRDLRRPLLVPASGLACSKRHACTTLLGSRPVSRVLSGAGLLAKSASDRTSLSPNLTGWCPPLREPRRTPPDVSPSRPSPD